MGWDGYGRCDKCASRALQKPHKQPLLFYTASRSTNERKQVAGTDPSLFQDTQDNYTAEKKKKRVKVIRSGGGREPSITFCSALSDQKKNRQTASPSTHLENRAVTNNTQKPVDRRNLPSADLYQTTGSSTKPGVSFNGKHNQAQVRRTYYGPNPSYRTIALDSC